MKKAIACQGVWLDGGELQALFDEYRQQQRERMSGGEIATWAALDSLDWLFIAPDLAYHAGVALSHIPDAVGGVIEGVGHLPELAGDAVGGMIAGVGHLPEFAGNVAESAGNLMEGAFHVVGDIPEIAGNVAESAGNLMEGAFHVVGDLPEIAGSVAEAGASFLETLFDLISSIFD